MKEEERGQKRKGTRRSEGRGGRRTGDEREEREEKGENNC